MGLILNSTVKMKNTGTRILVYTLNPDTFTPVKPVFIQSIFAVLLTLFDGDKSYEQVVEEICFLTNKEYSTENVQWVEDRLAKLKEQIGVADLLVEKESADQKPRYHPMDFAISSDLENLDLSNQRIDFPLIIKFDVTTKCQMACKYCYHPRYKMDEYISLERLDQLFDECAEHGCETIILTGGDPFNRPDLLEIMKLIRQKGLNYFTSTKSYLDREICQRLKEEAGLQLMQISLDSADPTMAAFLTGMDDGFHQRTLETIQNLHQAGIAVRVKSVLTGQNIDSLPDLLKLCQDLGVEQVDLALYQRSLWSHSDDLFVVEEQLRRAKEVIENFSSTHAEPQIFIPNMNLEVITNVGCMDQLFENRGVCEAGRIALTLLPNGEVSICEHLDYTPEAILGDLKVQSIQELWNSDRVLNFLAPPPRSIFPNDAPCKTCSDEDYETCHRIYSRCMKDCYGYFGSYDTPDIRCKLASVDGYRIS